MKTVERHKKTDFGDVWYVNSIDGSYRFAIYKYDDDNDTIYLSNVFVKEDSRKQGYGNEILNAAEEYAMKMDAKSICLKVLSGSDVHRWYKRHGYVDLEKDEEERGYIWMKKDMKLEESVWADIYDRSTGDSVRKEDDVNHMNFDTFADYIKDNYSEKGNWFSISESDDKTSRHIEIDIISDITLSFNVVNGKIYNILVYSHRGKPVDVPGLKKIFNVNIIGSYTFGVVEKDWTKSNNTFVKLIEFFLNKKTNESIWADIYDRSTGETVRKEDDYLIDENELEKSSEICIKRYVIQSVYCDKYDGTPETFYECIQKWDENICTRGQLYDKRHRESVNPSEVIPSYIKKNWEQGKSYKSLVSKRVSDVKNEIKKTGFVKKPGESINDTLSKWFNENSDIIAEEYDESIGEYVSDYYREGGSSYTELNVDDWWDDLDYIEQIKIYQEHMKKTNESIWADIYDRSTGDTIRKEDDVLTDIELSAANEFVAMYCRSERAHYIQNHIVPPPPSGRKENDYDRVIKYIEDRRDENLFKNVGDYDKIIRYIKKNWEKMDIDKKIKKYIFSPDIMRGKKIVECDGVPGGLTPDNVGGMGAAYFPGPNGEPGSGDLPSPTGVVYHQVAPFTMFLKGQKKKKKKKKFRIEDEPCAHSENPPIYSHVDDFRDYVDRVYNQIDRKK